MLAGSPAVADRVVELRERGWLKIDLGQGHTPHAEGGFGTAGGRPPSTRATSRRSRWPTRSWRSATRWLWSRRRRTSSSTPPSRTRAASTRRSRSPTVCVHPDDAGERGIADGARVRVYNDRGDFTCARGSPTTPVRAFWWRRWAGGTATTRAGAAGRPPRRSASPRRAHAPIFNDNRVEVVAL